MASLMVLDGSGLNEVWTHFVQPKCVHPKSVFAQIFYKRSSLNKTHIYNVCYRNEGCSELSTCYPNVTDVKVLVFLYPTPDTLEDRLPRYNGLHHLQKALRRLGQLLMSDILPPLSIGEIFYAPCPVRSR